jgi:hypothetical protein
MHGALSLPDSLFWPVFPVCQRYTVGGPVYRARENCNLFFAGSSFKCIIIGSSIK